MLALYLAACHSPGLLLQFLRPPEDGRKKRPNHVQQLLQLQINILPSCITLVLSYILAYDARKPKHKILIHLSRIFTVVIE